MHTSTISSPVRICDTSSTPWHTKECTGRWMDRLSETSRTAVRRRSGQVSLLCPSPLGRSAGSSRSSTATKGSPDRSVKAKIMNSAVTIIHTYIHTQYIQYIHTVHEYI